MNVRPPSRLRDLAHAYRYHLRAILAFLTTTAVLILGLSS